LNSDEEVEMISFGSYVNNIEFYILVIKHYIYSVNFYGQYFCFTTLEEIEGSKVFLSIPFKCDSSYCYYILGTRDSLNKLNLYLIANEVGKCSYKIGNQLEIDGDSDNFNCHLLDYITDYIVISCFYQNNTSNKIISSNYL
jgi:hypothetical protein